MRIPFRKAPAPAPAPTGLCPNGCGLVELDSEGRVKPHSSWYQGGRRGCYGAGQTPREAV